MKRSMTSKRHRVGGVWNAVVPCSTSAKISAFRGTWVFESSSAAVGTRRSYLSHVLEDNCVLPAGWQGELMLFLVRHYILIFSSNSI